MYSSECFSESKVEFCKKYFWGVTKLYFQSNWLCVLSAYERMANDRPRTERVGCGSAVFHEEFKGLSNEMGLPECVTLVECVCQCDGRYLSTGQSHAPFSHSMGTGKVELQCIRPGVLDRKTHTQPSAASASMSMGHSVTIRLKSGD